MMTSSKKKGGKPRAPIRARNKTRLSGTNVSQREPLNGEWSAGEIKRVAGGGRHQAELGKRHTHMEETTNNENRAEKKESIRLTREHGEKQEGRASSRLLYGTLGLEE